MNKLSLIPVVLALAVFAVTGGLMPAWAAGISVIVHVVGEDGSPLAGVTVVAVNSTGQLGAAVTDSTGRANLTLTADGPMLIVSRGPIAWTAVNVTEEGLDLHLWLNSTSFTRVNVTVVIGGEAGVVDFNATFYGALPGTGVIVSGGLAGLRAPVKIYVQEDCRAELKIPGSVRKMFVVYDVLNVSLTRDDGTKVFTNATDIEVNSTIRAIEIRYSATTPLYLGLPLQTWIIIALIAVVAGVLVVMVKAKKAAAAIAQHYRKRRAIREYEIMNGFNGFLQSIDAAPMSDKDRIARRMLKRVD